MLAKTNPRLPESARAGLANHGLAQRVLAAFQQGRWQEVERMCAQLDAQTLHGSVNLQHVLGMSLWHQGRAHEALPCLDRALALRGDVADLHSNRAVILEDLGQLEKALSGYNTALKLSPASASIWSNRGTLHKRMGRWRQALQDLQHACRLAPDQAQYHYNYAVVLQALGELQTAQAHLRIAMRLQTNHPEAPWNLALCALLQGDWQQGWPLHEARWRKRGESLSQPLQTPKPRWMGQTDVRLLLWAEQGVGDEVFFASMLKDMQARVRSLTVTCDARLLPLLERSHPGIRFVDKHTTVSPEEYDAHLPIGSLGLWCRATEADFKIRRAFLSASPARLAQVRALLQKHAADVAHRPPASAACPQVLWVGLSWKSANPHTGGERSLRLQDLVHALRQGIEAVASKDRMDVRLVSLQYGDVSQEIEALERQTGVRVHQLPEVDNQDDLEGLAALMQACDLVVSVQNATLHLAGALGRPMWPLLRHVPDWRWQMHRIDSVWYPTARLIRQPSVGDWAGALQALSLRMQVWLGER